MRDDSKPVEFEFEFSYSYRNNMVTGNTITVVEPSFADRNIYRQCKAWIGEAFRGLQEMTRRDMESKASEAPAPAETAEESEVDPYVVIQMGLSAERFVQFCDFVERSLTNNVRLAYCGTDRLNAVPVTQVIWQDLANKGGVEAIEKVCAAFAGFFLGGPSRRTSTETVSTDGSETPSGLPADPLAPSPSAKRKK